jgi:hypothetical protein
VAYVQLGINRRKGDAICGEVGHDEEKSTCNSLTTVPPGFMVDRSHGAQV